MTAGADYSPVPSTTPATSFGASPKPLPRALVLGGTVEAAQLAERMVGEGFAVINSLLGVTESPRKLAGETRFGGFGGGDGLAVYLGRKNVQLVIDATHPFAENISANAHIACTRAAVPRLALYRKPWGDEIVTAERISEPQQAVAHLRRVNFLALGSRGWRCFTRVTGKKFILRSFSASLVLPRGWAFEPALRSYCLQDEIACLRKHKTEVLVCRDSGGEPTKLRAAAALGIKVVMITRPKPPPPPRVATVAEALEWAGKVVMGGGI